jgi:hypothetical protein
MNAAFHCPGCHHGVRTSVVATDESLKCPHCGQSIAIAADAFDQGQLQRCLVCPSTDLFVRKDFPQRLGVAIVVLGIVASCVTWAMSLLVATFAVLLATALVDVVLFLIVPDALSCYRCGAIYRLAEGAAAHGPFNLETHERHRQQAARMAG